MRDALVALISEKPYDSIVVKEILDRANVGRSTFYMHFRDKDDLLLSGIQQMLGPLPEAGLSREKGTERILWFSLPVFEHHYRHAHAWGDRIGPRARAILHEHLRMVLADVIAGVTKKDFRIARTEARRVPPDLLSHYVAATFVLVLNWWLDKGMFLPPKEIDSLFRALTMPTLHALAK
ncbi:MAG TPA: TetR/AcrR family transcriptional regulator [Terriglobales bacterium]|nr:TetR/AcrR family transcriptional regulator [Terriglobales bacterium]